MSSSINRVTISGNLTRDAEVAATQSGTGIVKFALAVNERKRDPETGSWSDYPNFVDCVMFGNRAAAVSQYLVRGKHVSVDGKLHFSQWTAPDGQRRSRLEVCVTELDLGPAKADGSRPAAEEAAAPLGPTPELYDADIPF